MQMQNLSNHNIEMIDRNNALNKELINLRNSKNTMINVLDARRLYQSDSRYRSCVTGKPNVFDPYNPNFLNGSTIISRERPDRRH